MDAMTYESVSVVESKAAPGVMYTVVKMSFARRMELMRRVRDLARRAEFEAAGGTTGGKMESALIEAEIDGLYLRWGLQAVSGLEVDGRPATPEVLAECGPEELFREAVAAVRA